MPVEVAMNTPLADALQVELQKKLVEVGWAPGDSSDTTMAEYLVLMVVNGKMEDEIAVELASDLLNLSPEDNSAREFSKWLFNTIETQNEKINGPPPAQAADAHDGGDQDMDMDLPGSDSLGDIAAPTGPKAMRNGAGSFRGGRDKRVVGQTGLAVGRSGGDSALHRVRGQGDRINSHGRGGPHARGGIGGFGNGRQSWQMNGRTAANFNHALAAAGVGGGQPWLGGQPAVPPMQPGPMDVYAMLEQQSRMMQQMQEQMQQQQQLMQNSNNRRGGPNQNNRGRPLSERVQRPPHSHQNHQNHQNHQSNQNNQNNKPFRNGHQDIVLGDLGDLSDVIQKGNGAAAAAGADGGEGAAGGDVDMGSEARRDTSSPAETMCKFNLHCANKDCKFAHQSPAAPPGTVVNVQEVCSFGAACKNKKCTGRHPSPAARMAHQSEQDCKFFPNCTNPHCPFRHPAMPLCRNGGDCSVRGCKFTHIQTMCKFRPCTNRFCTFKHEDGQRGTFPDKVWTADGASDNSKEQQSQPHISERRFVDESAPEETILPGADKDMASEEATIS